MEQQNRQLAAILFTDIVGYTAMMQKDEQNALAVTRHYIATLKKSAETFHGRILNDYGDGSLCCFPSATEAVKAAVLIQQQLQQEPKVPLRIGIHVGELFFEETKVMGDSVNVASRIQSLGQANTILFSKEVFDKLKNQPEYKSVSLGKFEFKNVDEPLEIFALANEGLMVPKREQLTGKLKEIKRSSIRRKLLIAAASFLILVSTIFLYRKFFAVAGFAGEKSIAVLPFDNSGSEKLEDYVSDGITQDIISNLAKISSLQKVIGWISVRSFKKTTKTIKEIANELGVAAMLTGTFEKRADKIRVIAELTEAETGKRLWGEDFEYKTADIATIQADVVEKITSALRAEVTQEEQTGLSKHSTQNEDAYKYYIKGRFYWTQRTRGSFDSAEQYFKKAVDLDPEFALAYSGLADCYKLNNQKGLSTGEALPIAKAYLAKALALDSTLGEAWTSVGFIKSHFEYDWKGGRKVLEKAISLSPNFPPAHLYYGNVLLYNGLIEAGLNEVRKALELDPVVAQYNWTLGNRYYCARKYDLAIDQLQKMLILFPNDIGAKQWIGLSYLQKKMYARAIDVFTNFSETEETKSALLGYAYALSGDKVRAEAELKKTLLEHSATDPYFLALIYIALKNYNEALNQLEKGYSIRTIFMITLKINEDWDPIRSEPRFKALLKKLNFD
jgi:adenylate cyclase